MREKLKQFWRVVVLAMIILLAGCERDLYEEQIIEHKRQFEKISLADIPFMNKQIQDRKKKLKEKSTDVNFFDLVKPEGVILRTKETGEKEYTFDIAYEETDKYFNLLAKENEEGLKFYLITYECLQKALWKQKLENKELGNIAIDVYLQEYNEATGVFTSRCNIDIIEDIICPSGTHGYGGFGWGDHGLEPLNECTYEPYEWYFSYSYQIDCFGGGDGFGLITPVSGGIEGNIGGGSNNPCNKLKNKSNDPNFKTAFNALNIKSKYDLTTESGYQEVPNGNGTTSFVACALDGNHKVIFSASSTGGIHVHQDHTENPDEHTVKMLSPADIQSLFGTGNHNTSAGLNSMDAYIMMLSSEGAYAIMITNPDYNAIANALDWDELRNKYREDAGKFTDGDGNFSATQGQLQRLFFDTLERANLQDKVALYKVTNFVSNTTSNTPTNIAPQWAKVNPTTLALEPCSN